MNNNHARETEELKRRSLTETRMALEAQEQELRSYYERIIAQNSADFQDLELAYKDTEEKSKRGADEKAKTLANCQAHLLEIDSLKKKLQKAEESKVNEIEELQRALNQFRESGNHSVSSLESKISAERMNYETVIGQLKNKGKELAESLSLLEEENNRLKSRYSEKCEEVLYLNGKVENFKRR